MRIAFNFRPEQLFLSLGILVMSFYSLAHAAESAETILKRAIAASGERFQSVKGPMLWMTRGTAYSNGASQPFVAQYASQWPNWFRREIEGAYVVTANGDAIWVSTGSQDRTLENLEYKSSKQQIRLRWISYLFPLQDRSQYSLNPLPRIEIEGRPCVGIHATHTDGDAISLYFDNENYLLRKIDSYLPSTTSKAMIHEEIYLSEHRSVGGVKIAHHEKRVHNGRLIMEAQRVATKTGATLDPEFFKTPE